MTDTYTNPVRNLMQRALGAARRRFTERRHEASFRRAAREGMVPPQSLWHLVGADHSFVEQGESQFRGLVKTAQLSPTSAVLDVGCGLGKTAAHFARYLEPPGFYEGFDIQPLAIRWCEAAITTRHPHVSFKLVPIQSARYNPDGSTTASTFVFPYPSGTFDLVFLDSVFTHMMLDDVRQYIFEIERVLKAQGVCYASFFLLNDEKRSAMKQGLSGFTFSHHHQGSFLETVEPPEAAVAQEEARVLAIFEEAGLVVQEPKMYGLWHKAGNHHQDTIVARKQ